jgi:hypothetical protein
MFEQWAQDLPHKLPVSSHSTHFHQLTQPAKDLTGQVFETELWYFAYGGSADVWKGQWNNQDVNIMMVQTYLLACWPHLKPQFSFVQVAVKVIKGPKNCDTGFVQF